MDFGVYLGHAVGINLREEFAAFNRAVCLYAEGFLISSIVEPFNGVHTIALDVHGNTVEFDARLVKSIERLSEERAKDLMVHHEIRLPFDPPGLDEPFDESKLANCRCTIVPITMRPDYKAARWEW